MDTELIKALASTNGLSNLFSGIVDSTRKSWLDINLQRLLDRAYELSGKARYDEALALYLEVFEKSRSVDLWSGSRFSFLLGDIARMNYAPAREALLHMRDICESKMLAGFHEFVLIQEWQALNRYLKDSRTLVFYDELVLQELDISDVLKEIKNQSAADFVHERRYSEYSRDDVISMLRGLAGIVRSLAPDGAARKSLKPELLKDLKDGLLHTYSCPFEIAVANEFDDEAAAFAHQLELADPSIKTFVRLIRAARRATNTIWSDKLLARATSFLSPSDHQLLLKELGS